MAHTSHHIAKLAHGLALLEKERHGKRQRLVRRRSRQELESAQSLRPKVRLALVECKLESTTVSSEPSRASESVAMLRRLTQDCAPLDQQVACGVWRVGTIVSWIQRFEQRRLLGSTFDRHSHDVEHGEQLIDAQQVALVSSDEAHVSGSRHNDTNLEAQHDARVRLVALCEIVVLDSDVDRQRMRSIQLGIARVLDRSGSLASC